MKKLLILTSIVISAILTSCGGSEKQTSGDQIGQQTTETETEEAAPTYDPKRGQGKHSSESLALTDKLDAGMAANGEKASDVKCTSCHKMTDEKLVGPGWKGVTKRRTPEWIMNFITNPDPMIDKDPEAQAMLELCLVRMPNQNLTDDEAREILEYMRKNDGVI